MRRVDKLLTLLVMIVFLSNFIFAINIIDTKTSFIKQGDTLILDQFCVNSTYANITSIRTSSINLLGETSMVEISPDYYQYQFSNTSLTGTYDVVYHCNENGVDVGAKTDFVINTSGKVITQGEMLVYSLFIVICLFMIFISGRLIVKENKTNKTDEQLYQMRTRNEFQYFVSILKSKIWIVGVFGIYIFLLLFLSLSNQLVYNLGFMDLNEILKNVVLLASWGLIPFTLFWLGWIILVFYKTTQRIMKYQFGGFKEVM